MDDLSSVTTNLDVVASGRKNYGDLSGMTVSRSSAPWLDLVRDDTRQRGLHDEMLGKRRMIGVQLQGSFDLVIRFFFILPVCTVNWRKHGRVPMR